QDGACRVHPARRQVRQEQGVVQRRRLRDVHRRDQRRHQADRECQSGEDAAPSVRRVEADTQKLSVLELAASPLAPGMSPVRIRYRECGRGAPLVFLHGGWGYEVYPFDRQIAALASTHRIIIPDRSGYGGSSRVPSLATDFHDAAAAETLAVVDALGLGRPALWGHSDGAVIAALIGLRAP